MSGNECLPGRWLWPGLVLALLGTLGVSLGIGRFPVPWSQAAAALFGLDPGFGIHWHDTQQIVVRTVRLPRVLSAACAGGGLALAGAALQGIFRNPLVGPHVIGLSSGASLGGALAILCGWSTLLMIVASGLSAALALAVVLLLARVRGQTPVLMLVLAGIVTGALFAALTSMTVFLADPDRSLPGIVFWLMGSYASSDWTTLAVLATCLLVCALLLLPLGWRINILSLGDDDARLHGMPVESLRLLILAACCVMIAGQVSVSGIVGWIGLVVPHLARMLVGADHRRLLPAALLLGATFSVLADDIARTLTAAENPLGIVTALLGAPVFALILRRRARRGWSED